MIFFNWVPKLTSALSLYLFLDLHLPPFLTSTHGCQTKAVTSWSFSLCLSVLDMEHICHVTGRSQPSLLANLIVGKQIHLSWWFWGPSSWHYAEAWRITQPPILKGWEKRRSVRICAVPMSPGKAVLSLCCQHCCTQVADASWLLSWGEYPQKSVSEPSVRPQADTRSKHCGPREVAWTVWAF